MDHLYRRRFLQLATASGIGVAFNRGREVAAAANRQDPIRSATGSNVRVGLAAYSFRSHFGFMKGKPQQPADGRKIDMFEFVDYCATYRCGAELTSYFFPPDADDAYFLRLKRHAFLNGVPIVGTAIGNDFTIGRGQQLDQQIADAKDWIDRAALMGAPHIRLFAGTRQQLESAPGNMQIAIEALQQCADHAAERGIFIGVENHGGLTAEQVIEIVAGVESDWFGVNLDTGNFISDDPYQDLESCAPFAVNVQLKVKMKNTANETSDADVGRIASILSKANYRGFVVLEFEESNPFDHVPQWIAKLQKAFAN